MTWSSFKEGKGSQRKGLAKQLPERGQAETPRSATKCGVRGQKQRQCWLQAPLVGNIKPECVLTVFFLQ